MSDYMFAECVTVFQSWQQAVKVAVQTQWKLLDAQHQIALVTMNALTSADRSAASAPAATAVASTPERTASLAELERRAHENIERGLPPPRQVYEAPYRDRMDWTQLPDWARPSDPDLFGDSPHEG